MEPSTDTVLIKAEHVSLSVEVLKLALDAFKITEELMRLMVMALAVAVGAMLSATVMAAVTSEEAFPWASVATNL